MNYGPEASASATATAAAAAPSPGRQRHRRRGSFAGGAAGAVVSGVTGMVTSVASMTSLHRRGSSNPAAGAESSSGYTGTSGSYSTGDTSTEFYGGGDSTTAPHRNRSNVDDELRRSELSRRSTLTSRSSGISLGAAGPPPLHPSISGGSSVPSPPPGSLGGMSPAARRGRGSSIESVESTGSAGGGIGRVPPGGQGRAFSTGTCAAVSLPPPSSDAPDSSSSSVVVGGIGRTGRSARRLGLSKSIPSNRTIGSAGIGDGPQPAPPDGESRRNSDESIDPSVLGYGEGPGGMPHRGPRQKRRASFNLKSMTIGDFDLGGPTGLFGMGGGSHDASASEFEGGDTLAGLHSSVPTSSTGGPASRSALTRRSGYVRSMRGASVAGPSISLSSSRGGMSGAHSGDEYTSSHGRRGTFAIHRRTNTKSSGDAGSKGQGSSIGEGSAGSGSALTAIDAEAAMSQLENAGSAFESVAAAAAVVASSAAASSRTHRLYGVGDRVLVYLSVLNNTLGDGIAETLAQSAAEGAAGSEGASLADDDPEAHREAHDAALLKLRDNTTLVPVNRYGYPPWHGTDVNAAGGRGAFVPPQARAGPYVYVLATVRKVHFEEDARYYTVLRADTRSEQRSDAEWMEPVLSEAGYDAALKAAGTTREALRKDEEEEGGNLMRRSRRGSSFFCCLLGSRGPHGERCHEAAWRKAGRGYRFVRKRLRVQAIEFLYGNSPYACRIRMTGVNVLVLCSFTFMFLDQIRFAFLPASEDWTIMVVAFTVWSVLVLELLFEVLIRPSGYNVLIASERAYAPMTARYINGFHLFFEMTALIMFGPEFRCFSPNNRCGEAFRYSLLDSSLMSVLGPTPRDTFLGRLFFIVLRLRIFGLVRHWKKMWINHTYVEKARNPGVFHGFLLPESSLSDETQHPTHGKNKKKRKKKNKDDDDAADEAAAEARIDKKTPMSQDDKRLNKAATIGTALMVVNSHRALLLIVAIVGILPLIGSLHYNGGANLSSPNSVELLQQNNLALHNNTFPSCEYLYDTVTSFVKDNVNVRQQSPFSADQTSTYLLWARLLPVRCKWQRPDGLITVCPTGEEGHFCEEWEGATAYSTPAYFADKLNLRVGVITTHSYAEWNEFENVTDVEEGPALVNVEMLMFNVTAMYNQDHSVSFVNFSSFLLQFTMLALVLAGLTVLRGDAGRLVLDPLRRMLKIVLRYAANPLASTPSTSKKEKGLKDTEGKDGDDADALTEKDQLGNYETEQLINAISKITDLLRKCWGVAGAGIISANLARTQEGQTVVFNPTVPGKRVYALFAFAGINDFAYLLRSLDQDVMILINDVAQVVHDEVFRWGLGDSGQCNKNLGAAFLMVYRIGDFKEVQEKKARATDVIFSSQEKRSAKKSSAAIRRRHQGSAGKSRAYHKRPRSRATTKDEMDTLQLASLPGIQGFTDRALLGMLKSYAGIHREKSLLNWRDDFRLGAGVGAFSVDMIFGMDAGWAVEGAVGSEYKIDATYLSPHVNMASRMMSACKQYGVTILLSQAVEELLSDKARAKLRHLDTVTVKGSSIAQRIFTYDARHNGVDFFLWERAPDEADVDSERYTPAIWNADPDLRGMRQHVSEEFEYIFSDGLKQYLAGNWGVAIERLKEANQVMITHGIEEGYVEHDTRGFASQLLKPVPNEQEEVTRVRNELGDGTCRCLISYMEREGGVAPKHWKHYRPLTSK